MKAPAVQWYWSDFLVDTMDWSCIEIGAYMRLLGHEWVNGCIPEDTKRQAIICRIDHGNYLKSVYPIVIGKFFFQNGGGYNRRLEEEREKQQHFVESQREKGKKRAEKMWEGHIATAISPATKRLQPEDSSSSSSSTSLKELTDNVGSVTKRPRRTYAFSYDWDKKEFIGITETMKAEWHKAYPTIDIEAQIRDMQVKIPANGYHKTNWPGFVVRWLSRAQDKARSNGNSVPIEDDALSRARAKMKAEQEAGCR